MTVSLRHVFSQGAVLRALSGVAVSALRRNGTSAIPATPGPWVESTLPPRPVDLLRDYVRNVGGEPSWYRGVVPAHLFPQWGFPLAAQAIAGLPYPLVKVMNAGCRMEVRDVLPASEPLVVRARLESIDDDGRRALITQRIVTGTRSKPDAVVADLRAFVPLEQLRGETKARPTVPIAAKEIAFLSIESDAGLDFAKLTGDFNPIHWVPAYARAAGFRGCILHGFGTMARALEALNRAVFAGDPTRLAALDVRFTKPLVLPARVGVYVEGDRLFVGDARGGSAYLEGSFSQR